MRYNRLDEEEEASGTAAVEAKRIATITST